MQKKMTTNFFKIKKEIYCKKLNGDNLDEAQILKSISNKSIGTFFFPHVSEFKGSEDQKVI
jgi:hypothetical protein